MPGFASPAVPRSLSPAVPIAYVPEAAASGPQPANPGIAPLAAPVPVGAGPVAPPAASLPPVVSAQAAIVRITAVSKDGAERESYPLSDSLDIGRTEGDIRFADDRYLSDRHARVFVREGKVFLQDLGSVNGTYYRLKQVSFPIDDQDLILLGQQVIRFELVNREDWPGPGCEHGTLLFGTPGGRPFARLSQRGMEGVAMNVYYIRGQETVVGREIGDIVFTDDPFMSRRHAVFKRGDTGGFSITDVGSSNGTFVRLREAVPVAAGDEFRVGQQLFRVNPIEVRR